MTSRLSALRIPAMAAPVKGEDIASFARFLRETPIIDGRIVSVTFAASTTANLTHGLGRNYRGCIEIGRSSGTVVITALELSAAVSAGADVSVAVPLAASAVTSATFTFWVF